MMRYSLFLWLKKAQRKSYEKETPRREFRAVRRASQGSALTIRALLKKRGQNFWEGRWALLGEKSERSFCNKQMNNKEKAATAMLSP
jgi:hypothetical protein